MSDKLQQAARRSRDAAGVASPEGLGECSCTFGPDEADFDPGCPFHGTNGSMVTTVPLGAAGQVPEAGSVAAAEAEAERALHGEGDPADQS